MEKQLNYGNKTNCKRSILFNRLLKLSKDGASTTYSGNILVETETCLFVFCSLSAVVHLLLNKAVVTKVYYQNTYIPSRTSV